MNYRFLRVSENNHAFPSKYYSGDKIKKKNSTLIPARADQLIVALKTSLFEKLRDFSDGRWVRKIVGVSLYDSFSRVFVGNPDPFTKIERDTDERHPQWRCLRAFYCIARY